MEGKYRRAVLAGLLFGAVLAGCNALSYLYYQEQLADFNATYGGRVDNLCVGLDTYVYLIVASAIVYAACGVFSIWYARRYVERPGRVDGRVHAARTAALAGLVAGVLATVASGLFAAGVFFYLRTGGLPANLPDIVASIPGWALVYAMYAVIGTAVSMVSGAFYYDRIVKKAH